MEKPKSKVGKIVIFIVAMLVAILIGVVITQTDEKALQRYSVTNNLAKGYGVIFETLKQCDLEVERILLGVTKLQHIFRLKLATQLHKASFI